VVAGGERLPQPRRCLRDGIGQRESDSVETLLARGAGNGITQRGRIAQKSRSA
jgi:hypothetical protein